MVKEEILEGLRSAVAKGEPLRQAMMSFYNAGYSKSDVEEAARALGTPQIQPQTTQPQQVQPVQPQVQPQVQPVQPTPSQATQPTTPQQPQPIQPPPQQIQQQPVQVGLPQAPSNLIQRVSGYEGQRPQKVGMTTILIFFLLALLGILAAIFLFKDKIAEILNNLL